MGAIMLPDIRDTLIYAVCRWILRRIHPAQSWLLQRSRLAHGRVAERAYRRRPPSNPW